MRKMPEGDHNLKNFATHQGITYEVVWRSIKKIIKALPKPFIGHALFVLLLLSDHQLVLAASGGRMGGSSFSSSSSRRSRIRTRSAKSSSASNCSTQANNQESDGLLFNISFLIIVLIIREAIKMVISVFDETTSVLKLQVGLLGTAKSLQMDLNVIAKTTNTSTSEGFKNILKETILSLLRHPDYCISSYSSVDMMSSAKEGEKRFNRDSIVERGKFDKETLVNFNYVKKECATNHRSNSDSNEFIVVTIIVAARGEHELPPIKNGAELKKTLEKIASIPSTNIMAVEVLWTPQQENDTLSEQELLADYPLLRPFR